MAVKTHVFRGLQVDDGHFPSLALGEEWKVSTWFDLQGGAERQCQVCSSGCRRKRNTSHTLFTCVTAGGTFLMCLLLTVIYSCALSGELSFQCW